MTETERVDGRHARRLRTEQRLLDAVGALLREGGMAALGVNAIAARAGVEKVLVYRYFDGLEGLMDAYAARSNFWPSLDEILGPGRELLRDDDHARAGAKILARYARALRLRPITLDLLAWECANPSALTRAMEAVREQRSRELDAELAEAGFPLDRGLAELSALFLAAINYLAVRGRSLAIFGGLPLATDADWKHIETIFEASLRAMLTQTRATGAEGKAKKARKKKTKSSRT